MTRLFISGLGLGITLTLVYASFWGQQSCVGLSFAAGIVFTCGVLAVALGLLYLLGKSFGWIVRIPNDHSQMGGD